MSRFGFVAVLLTAACGRVGFDGTSGVPDGSSGMPDLLVSITTDRMAGPPTMSSIDELPAGTVGLSLREALVIANNHAGPDLIGFDANAFGAAASITIVTELVIGDSATTLDATGRSVTISGGIGYAGNLLHVTGANAVVDGLALQGGGVGVQAASVNAPTLRHLTITDTSSDAIHVDGCADVTIEDNRIERAVGDPVFVRAATNAVVQRNFVSLLTKAGSVHGVYLEMVSNSHIIGNTIDPGTAFLINLTDSSDNEVVGNILDRGDTGITLFGDSQRNLIFRNVVISPVDDSVYLDATVSNNKVVNNTFFMAPDITDTAISTMAANNLVSSTPGDFVDPASYDFHLVAGNAAIDAATDLGMDMLPDLPARFLGAAPDLGGVESF